MKRLAGFDFFGTLIDSKSSFAYGCRRLERDLSIGSLDLKEAWVKSWALTYRRVLDASGVWRTMRWTFEESLQQALRDLGVRADRIDIPRAVDLVLGAFISRSELYGGAKVLLEWSRGKLDNGIVSNSDSDIFWAIFDKLRVDRYVERDLVYVSEERKSYKPNPKMLLSLMERTSVGPDEAIFVGDSQEDVMMSKRASVLSILVDRGKRVQEKADLVVKRLDELIPILESDCERA